MNFLISKDDAQKILTYLSRQPFVDVFQLVEVLSNLQPAPEPETKPEHNQD